MTDRITYVLNKVTISPCVKENLSGLDVFPRFKLPARGLESKEGRSFLGLLAFVFRLSYPSLNYFQ